MNRSDRLEEDLLTGSLGDTEREVLIHAVRFFGVLDESVVADNELQGFLSASIFMLDANRGTVRMTHLLAVLRENRRFFRDRGIDGQTETPDEPVDSD